MIGLFDRHFLTHASHDQTMQALHEPNRDSFILDWSLDEAEPDNGGAEGTASESNPRAEPCGR